MKKNKKYLVLSLLTVFVITAMGFGTLSFAQTVTPLSCSVSASSVGINQVVTLSATGGNGSFVWSGQNLNVTNSAGSQFAVSYPTPGTYAIMVSSANQTATCNVNITSGSSTGNLTCSPAVQNVVLGQTASVSATGGNDAYTWSSPDLSITNPNGSGFSASYASIGLKTLTVSSSGLVTTCAINVLTNGTVTPGFPNTGESFGQ